MTDDGNDFAALSAKIFEQESTIAAKDAQIAKQQQEIEDLKKEAGSQSERIIKLQGIIADHIPIKGDPEPTKAKTERSFGELYHEMIKKNQERK